MADSNKIIQSLWIGSELSPMEIICIRSYLAHGHKFELYVYEDVKNIPEGASVKDANLIIPRKDMRTDVFNGYVNFSNQFRYALLHKTGGWWVDMDTVCLKPFDFESDFVFSSETLDEYGRCQVNNTYIKSASSASNASFLKDCSDFIAKRGYDYIHWGELGIHLLSRMIFRNGLSRFIQDPIVFCPVSFYRVRDFIENKDCILPETSYALHWWNELWRRNKIDKYATFPKNSLYEKMKRKYT